MGERRPGPDALTYPWGDESGTTYNAPALTGNYNCNAVCAAYEPAYHGSESATYTATGGYTTPVTAYPGGASTDGVLDLCGNCWEWTTSVITATHGGEMGQ